MAGYGRRLLALIVDWLLALLLAQLLSAVLHWNSQIRSLVTLAIFGVLSWLLIAIFETTIGKWLARLRVTDLNGGRVGFVEAFERAVLLVLLIPAVIWDRDHRGLHDRAARTVVIER